MGWTREVVSGGAAPPRRLRKGSENVPFSMALRYGAATLSEVWQHSDRSPRGFSTAWNKKVVWRQRKGQLPLLGWRFAVHSCIPALRHSGTPTFLHCGIPAIRPSGTPALLPAGTAAFLHSCIPALQHAGTAALRHCGIAALRHSGAPAGSASGGCASGTCLGREGGGTGPFPL